MALAPSISTVAEEIAKKLRRIKVTVTCHVCKESRTAVFTEAPVLGLQQIGYKGTPLEHAKEYYREIFAKAHPHKMIIIVEYTDEKVHQPRLIDYVPLLQKT